MYMKHFLPKSSSDLSIKDGLCFIQYSINISMEEEKIVGNRFLQEAFLKEGHVSLLLSIIGKELILFSHYYIVDLHDSGPSR